MFEIEDWGNSPQKKEDKLIAGLFGSCDSKLSSEPTKKKKRKHRGDNDNVKKTKLAKLETKKQQRLHVGGTENSSETSTNNELIVSQESTENEGELLDKRAKNSSESEDKNRSDQEFVAASITDDKQKKKKKKKKMITPPTIGPIDEQIAEVNMDDQSSKTNKIDSESNNDNKNNNCSDNKNLVVKSDNLKKTGLMERMTRKLESSRFRWINEQLYTSSGDNALDMFSEEPALFDVYHRGFRAQVEHWPVNPVHVIIQWVKQRSPSLVLADFGCGDAVIAQTVPNKVHSFDLVAKNDLVTACNMAKVPLESSTVDVAIFCLSLMGTDLHEFVQEAHRVLKKGGILKVAEVVSRLDVDAFIKSLDQLGFQFVSKDDSNKMFILLDFKKVKRKMKVSGSSTLAGLELKPCIYKRR